MIVHFLPSDRKVTVGPDTTLYDAAVAAGLPVASSCGAEGACGKCGLRLISGRLSEPSDREVRVALDNRCAPGLRLSCMVVIESDAKVTADYW